MSISTTRRRFLGSAAVIKCQQYGIKSVEIHARFLPAGVEVTRFRLGRDEAAVHVRCKTTGIAELLQSNSKSAEQLAAPPCGPKSVIEFIPGGPVDTWRQVAGVFKFRSRNTTIILCLQIVNRRRTIIS